MSYIGLAACVLLSTIKSDFTTSNVIEWCKKNSAHHILTAIKNKNQNRLQKRKGNHGHAKSISTLWWGHEFRRIWNCQAVRTRYIVVIKREGMMIMRFDWRLPRQERPWRELRRCYLFALLCAGQWKIHLHCSTSQFGRFGRLQYSLEEMSRETITNRLKLMKKVLKHKCFYCCIQYRFQVMCEGYVCMCALVKSLPLKFYKAKSSLLYFFPNGFFLFSTTSSVASYAQLSFDSSSVQLWIIKRATEVKLWWK